MQTRYTEIEAFITKDGSVIRELMHPIRHVPSAMSVAEATVAAGATTHLHRHLASEEIYHFTAGSGTMRLGEHVFRVSCGDTVNIAAGTNHNVTNTGAGPMKIICVSHPPYSDEDTVLA